MVTKLMLKEYSIYICLFHYIYFATDGDEKILIDPAELCQPRQVETSCLRIRWCSDHLLFLCLAV
jgi:hypothetical protein